MPFRLMVDDLTPSLEFYVDSLGFELVEQWGPAFAMIKQGDDTVWLSGPQTSAAKPMPDGSQPVPGGWNRVVVQVDDLDSVYADLKSKGAKFRNEPISGPGGKQVLVEDPSGNCVELFESRD